MIHRCATVFSFLTIASLNTILLLGASLRELESIRTVFDGVVVVMDLSLVISSLLLGYLFFKNQAYFLSILFFLNIALFVVASILRIRGVLFSPIVLYGADLYWLNLYLVSLARNRAILVGHASFGQNTEDPGHAGDE